MGLALALLPGVAPPVEAVELPRTDAYYVFSSGFTGVGYADGKLFAARGGSLGEIDADRISGGPSASYVTPGAGRDFGTSGGAAGLFVDSAGGAVAAGYSGGTPESIGAGVVAVTSVRGAGLYALVRADGSLSVRGQGGEEVVGVEIPAALWSAFGSISGAGWYRCGVNCWAVMIVGLDGGLAPLGRQFAFDIRTGQVLATDERSFTASGSTDPSDVTFRQEGGQLTAWWSEHGIAIGQIFQTDFTFYRLGHFELDPGASGGGVTAEFSSAAGEVYALQERGLDGRWKTLAATRATGGSAQLGSGEVAVTGEYRVVESWPVEAPVLRLSRVAGGGGGGAEIRLEFESVPGVTYRPEFSAESEVWQQLPGVLASTDLVSLGHPYAGGTGLYRVRCSVE